MGGQIVDATVVEARRPRLSEEREGDGQGRRRARGWSPAKRAQMDTDGRWTLKRGRRRPPRTASPASASPTEIAVPVFGYKNHVGIDRRHGFIRTFAVTDAAEHDGRQLGRLLDPREHRQRGLGRHRLPLGGQPRAAGAPRAGAAVPAAEAARQADAAAPGRGNASRARVRVAVEHVFAARSAACAWSSARSAWPAPRPSSGSPTWSPTCAAWSGSRPTPHRPDRSERPSPPPGSRNGRHRTLRRGAAPSLAQNHLKKAVLRGVHAASKANHRLKR